MEKQKNIRINGVIFDFDGTLFDLAIDWGLLKNTLTERFKKYGYKIEFTPLTPKLNAALTQIKRDLGIETAQNIKKDCFDLIKSVEKQGVTQGKFLPYAKEIISFLQSQNMSVGIVSSNSHEIIKQVCEKHNLSIDSIVGREDVETLKPDSIPVIRCLKELHINAIETIGVGNSKEDITAYKKAGLFRSFFLSSDILIADKNTIPIQSLEEIMTWKINH